MITSLEFLEAEPIDLDEMFCTRFLDEDGIFRNEEPDRCAHYADRGPSGNEKTT